MTKVLTFSRQYPSYHIRKGQPTFFVEKVLNGLNFLDIEWYDNIPNWTSDFCASIENDIMDTKFHTIRSGNRFKVGDYFSPRVWSGKPYRSKQIIIADDIQVVKTWEFEISTVNSFADVFSSFIFINGKSISPDFALEVSKNDGLELVDFLLWFKFPEPFKGQIICWNDKIVY